MEFANEILLEAEQATVWKALNDPAVLAKCIPGCQSLEQTEDGMKAVVKMKIGPISATFKGSVQLLDLDPPNGYRISGKGEGGIAGFAKGDAVVSLAPAEAGTVMTYKVDAQVGGKMAQMGARLIDGVAKNMTEQFFTRFRDELKNASA